MNDMFKLAFDIMEFIVAQYYLTRAASVSVIKYYQHNPYLDLDMQITSQEPFNCHKKFKISIFYQTFPICIRHVTQLFDHLLYTTFT